MINFTDSPLHRPIFQCINQPEKIADSKTVKLVKSTILPSTTRQSTTRPIRERISPRTSELFATVNTAKEMERSSVLYAMKGAVNTPENFANLNQMSKKGPTQADLNNCFYAKVDREIAKTQKRIQGSEIDESTVKGIKTSLHQPIAIKNINCAFLPKNTLNKLSSMAALGNNYERFNAEYERLKNNINNIYTLVNSGRRPSKDLNEAILNEIRIALRNPTYQYLKECEDQPAVKFLHSLCLASYTKPKLLDSFKIIGDHIAGVTHSEIKAPGNENSNKGFSNFIKQSIDSGYKHGLMQLHTISDKFEYVREKSGIAFGSVLGSKFGRYATLGKLPYDPRGNLENNAGALFNETIKVGSKNCVLTNVYTSSPTIGNSISEEMKGALQAMENRHFMDKNTLSSDIYPYTRWVYTNLQNIVGSSNDENPRSVAIMQLNEEFPFSFHGITISLDSKFFHDKVVRGKEKSVNPVTYMNETNAQLCNEANFTLQRRSNSLCDSVNSALHKQNNSRTGYYFHTKTEEEKIEWKNALTQITESALETMTKEIVGEEWDWDHRAAYRELVHMGIIKYHQAKIAKELNSSREDIDVHHILTTNACKENIDRGGKTNAMLLWALSENTQENVDCAFSALHSRALLARYRIILSERLHTAYPAFELVSHARIQKFLEEQVKIAGAVQEERALPLQTK